MSNSLLRWPEVKALTSLSRTTAWRFERAGTFPKRRQLGANSVAWLESEVFQWINSRPTVEGTPFQGRPSLATQSRSSSTSKGKNHE